MGIYRDLDPSALAPTGELVMEWTSLIGRYSRISETMLTKTHFSFLLDKMIREFWILFALLVPALALPSPVEQVPLRPIF